MERCFATDAHSGDFEVEAGRSQMSGKAARVVITQRQQVLLQQVVSIHDGGVSTAAASSVELTGVRKMTQWGYRRHGAVGDEPGGSLEETLAAGVRTAHAG